MWLTLEVVYSLTRKHRFHHLDVGHPDNPKRYRICGAPTRQAEALYRHCTMPAGWGTDHPGEGRCKLHGGRSLRGPDSPNYIHGRYAMAFRGRLRKLYESHAHADGDPLDLLPELDVQRTMLSLAIQSLGGTLQPDGDDDARESEDDGEVLANYFSPNPSDTSHQAGRGGDTEKRGSKVSSAVDQRARLLVSIENLQVVLDYSNAVVRTVERIVSMYNQSAMTKAEVMYILAKIKEVMNEFIPEKDRQRAFIDKLARGIPGAIEAWGKAELSGGDASEAAGEARGVIEGVRVR